MLPAHVAAAYPVPPRYATSEGGFLLHKNAIAFFEHMLKTYANGEQCSLFLVRAMASRYLEKARTYLSQKLSQPFPDFYSYTNNKWPPNGDNIRRLYQQGSTNRQSILHCNPTVILMPCATLKRFGPLDLRAVIQQPLITPLPRQGHIRTRDPLA